jgi:hypothetical protein
MLLPALAKAKRWPNQARPGGDHRDWQAIKQYESTIQLPASTAAVMRRRR